MKTLLLALIALNFFLSPASADPIPTDPASESSIKELLAVTEVRKTLDGMQPQMEQMMRTMLERATAGREVSENERQTLEKVVEKITSTVKNELVWEKMEPMYVEIYKKSFNQEEVDSMLTFYKSKAGAAIIKKMPIVMQQTMTSMNQQILPLMERMEKEVAETIAEARKANKANKEAK